VIDIDTFAEQMSILADRFDRGVSSEMSRRYHAFLTDRMTTDQFRDAVDVIYAHDRFWPAPVRFLEAVGLDPSSAAATAWDQVLNAARTGGGGPASSYPPATAEAIRAIGGITALGRVNEDRLPFIKREFIAAYRAHGERAPSPALEAPTLKELTG